MLPPGPPHRPGTITLDGVDPTTRGPDGVASPSERQKVDSLFGVCSSRLWVRQVLAGGPFRDADALLNHADNVLLGLPEGEVAAALKGHPRVGGKTDHPSAAREQAGVADADDGVRAELAARNEEYENRFGYVYLVCASGRSAEDLLQILTERLAHAPEVERRVMLDELAKINRLRLQKLFNDGMTP